MPHVTSLVGAAGPLLNVCIAVSAPRQTALTNAGLPTPALRMANLLVDTGASMTLVDKDILIALGLTPTGTVPIHTPSTVGVPHNANLYDIALMIPGQRAATYFVPALPVCDGSFRAQGFDGLLGRDVLALGRMIYSGHDGVLMLSF